LYKRKKGFKESRGQGKGKKGRRKKEDNPRRPSPKKAGSR